MIRSENSLKKDLKGFLLQGLFMLIFFVLFFIPAILPTLTTFVKKRITKVVKWHSVSDLVSTLYAKNPHLSIQNCFISLISSYTSTLLSPYSLDIKMPTSGIGWIYDYLISLQGGFYHELNNSQWQKIYLIIQHLPNFTFPISTAQECSSFKNQRNESYCYGFFF